MSYVYHYCFSYTPSVGNVFKSSGILRLRTPITDNDKLKDVIKGIALTKDINEDKIIMDSLSLLHTIDEQ